MAAQDKTKHFWMKFYGRFFDKHEIKILLAEDHDYVFFYIALLLESISHEGSVRYNANKPYTPKLLSLLLNMPIDKVEKSIDALKEADLIEVKEDGTIFLPASLAMSGYDTGLAQRLKAKRGSNEPEVGSNEPEVGSVGFKRGSNDPKDKSIEYKDKSIDKEVDVIPARTREAPSWDMVRQHILSPMTPVRIPEKFAKEWFDECVTVGWVDSRGLSITSNWKNKLLYRWKDDVKEQRERNGGKTDAEVEHARAAEEAWLQKRLVEENDD